jgi:hypothetical protein
MPIPAGSTSHAHFASTPADPIRYDFPLDATVKQGGQSDHTVRHATSNMTHRTVHHQSHLTLTPNSKQATVFQSYFLLHFFLLP